MTIACRAFALTLALIMVSLPSTSWSQPRVAFVTSASGSSDLKTWDQATVGLTGLEAADSICVNLAGAAGLDNPGNFVAWLSDSTDDAYCRVHQLTGKRSANCGQAELPASAGPWVRTDGAPFGAAIADLLWPQNEVYAPLWLDETGSILPFLMSAAWTATEELGQLSEPTSTCSDWDGTPAGLGGMGWVDRTSSSWTLFGSLGCGGPGHLYCLETVAGPALVLPEPGERLAFVTEVTGSGDLGGWPDADQFAVGIAAGDSICRNRAEHAGLPQAQSYKAWLSDAGTHAKDRLEHDGPFYRLDGFQIAGSMAELTSGVLFTAINQTEFGDYITNESAWTGTNPDGSAHAEHCGSWQSTAGDGRGGRANVASGHWTSQDTIGCTFTFAHLYCLNDFVQVLIFEDGFENLEP
jgi:hypothetical protein